MIVFNYGYDPLYICHIYYFNLLALLRFLTNFRAASRRSSLYGGEDFLLFIIPCRRIFFNPASSAPAHKSCSALQFPDAPAGSVRRPPAPARPACRSAYCAPAPRPAPQREIGGVQFWVWERRGLSAAPWCDVAIFDLDTKLFFEVSQIIRIILLVFQAAIVYSQYFNRRRSFVAPISIISHLVGLMSIIPCNTIMTFIPFLF